MTQTLEKFNKPVHSELYISSSKLFTCSVSFAPKEGDEQDENVNVSTGVTCTRWHTTKLSLSSRSTVFFKLFCWFMLLLVAVIVDLTWFGSCVSRLYFNFMFKVFGINSLVELIEDVDGFLVVAVAAVNDNDVDDAVESIDDGGDDDDDDSQVRDVKSLDRL